jgi:AcrR family transcriptional regulator
MRPRGGRPPSEEARRAILDATLALLCEGGYAGLTMDAVAERACSSKATIYRHWSSKPDLVVDALAQDIAPAAIEPTGSLRDDLLAIARALITKFTETPLGKVMCTVTEAASRDPLLGRLMAQFRDERRAVTMQVLARAQARGEIRDGVDLDLAAQMLVGPIFFRLMVTQEPLDAALAEQIVDLILPGLTARG